MSFLDNLKRQAAETAAAQHGNISLIEHHTQLVEGACKTTLSYLSTLAQQLNVLEPPSGGRHQLDRQHSFTQLRQCNFRVDARRKEAEPLPGQARTTRELYDHLVIHWELQADQQLDIIKDFVPDIEKLEPRLRQSGAKVDTEARRDPTSGKLLLVRYQLPVLFLASVRIQPRHEEGLLTFKVMNLDDFDTVWATWPAVELTSSRLDELARWIVGQPHRFLDGAQHVRRIEP